MEGAGVVGAIGSLKFQGGKMAADAYMLFAECNAVYVRGVRHAFQERLQSAYGDDWWERGVLSALHDDQRENLETQTQRYPARDPIAALDHAHFGWIVRRHAAAAFPDIFGDSEAAYRRFRRVALMRNDWAHVQALSMFGVMQVIDTMKSILASLRRSEALEIEKISQGIEPQPGDTTGDFMAEQTISDMEEIDSDYIPTQPERPQPNFWNQLQSYLALDTSVVVEENNTATITVRVSNTAPVGADHPDVRFNSVQIEVKNADGVRESRGRRYDDYYGYEINLEPGQSHEIQYTSEVTALAFVEFDVSGQLDWERYFRFRKNKTLPSEVAIPILERFVERFESIDIKFPLITALDSLHTIDPSMTLADLASARTKLKAIPESIQGKTEQIIGLYRDFHLDGSLPPGKECSEIITFFNQVAEKINAVDNAIGAIDLDAIAQIIHDLEQIQLAIIRLEDVVKDMIAR